MGIQLKNWHYSGWTTGGRPRNRSSIAAGGRDFSLLQSVQGWQRPYPRRYSGRGVRPTTNLNLVSVAQQPTSGPCGLSAKVSKPQQRERETRTHTHTTQREREREREPVEHLWTNLSARCRRRCQDTTQQTQETNIHACGRVRTRDHSNQADWASDRRITSYGYRDR